MPTASNVGSQSHGPVGGAVAARERSAAYAAYFRYQDAADKARTRYLETRATVWADIQLACVRLSLTEPRHYPERAP